MANNNEEKPTNQLKQIPPKQEEEKIPTPINEKRLKRTYRVSCFTTFFALIAIAIAVYNAQLNYKLQKKLLNNNKLFTSELKQLEVKQTLFKEQLDVKAESIQQNQNELQNKVDDLNKHLQKAIQQKPNQSEDWILLKARYYLELAQINAHWSDNYNASIALLEQADSLLVQLNSLNVLEIRQMITKEIALLKAAPSIDIAGLLSRLDAAQQSVSNLTIQIQSTIDNGQSSERTNPFQTGSSSAWQQRVQESINLFKKLIVIRHNDEEIKPLMSPLFESLLKESIRLNLQEAQWAILTNNPMVYQLSLKQAIFNLKRMFNEKTKSADVLLKELDTLQHTQLIQEKPLIGLSLPLVNQLIENKELHGNQVPSSGQGEHGL